MVATGTAISLGRQQPALVSGDLALTATTLANGGDQDSPDALTCGVLLL